MVRMTRRICALFTATHSEISTYFGNITMFLKLPLTRAASTNGLQRYRAFAGADAPPGDGGIGLEGLYSEVAEVGVVDLLLGPRCWRVIERLLKGLDEGVIITNEKHTQWN